ncbi:fungal-specific transcription factor domain-containing protein [Ilyonectria sp. MPI-CAGE-AT-0026]|nr:fungal-specific transcription factor domain-containing protein [Ilyonectria sp. MPI-CAGE-AT-0026]
MPELTGNWLHFSAREPKRKRAELVCVFCHSKKIKCDLQGRKNQGFEKCSNCDCPDRECHLRPSKRGKHRPGAAAPDTRRDATSNDSPPDQDGELPEEPPEGPVQVDIDGPQTQLQSPSSLQDDRIPNTAHSGSAQALPVIFNPQPPQASISPTEDTCHSHAGDVDTGFLQVYGPENQLEAEQQELEAIIEIRHHVSDTPRRGLQQSFAETYWEYCYPWCPVLDRATVMGDIARSPLLENALSLAASHIQPPLVPHDGPAKYYDRARTIFYNDEEADGLTALKALTLFYWWAPRPPSTAHRHSSWWWTSVIIRHAQQMNLHREPSENHPLRDRMDLSLRRRIWWTVFARERLTALCQSKPCIIDPDDCNIQEPQSLDFPSDPISQHKGQIFIYWIRLCAIVGRVAKYLSKSSNSASYPFPVNLQQELVEWVHSLPLELQLPIGSATTESFDRDVHQLHLPYLTTIIILHLKQSAHDLPQALPPAILAASCIARILRDILSRGNARFLMAITCWYSGTAFIALLQACRIEQFAQEAEEDLDVLTHAVGQLQQMWASANVIRQGFERLRRSRIIGAPNNTATNLGLSANDSDLLSIPIHGNSHDFEMQSATLGMPDTADAPDWTLLFPFVTHSTSRIAKGLLSNKEQGAATRGFPSPENAHFHETLFNQYQDLLEPFMDYPLDFSSMNFQA